MSMQMDAEFQKEQNGTLFVWVGALGGGYWGGGDQGPPNQKIGLTSNTFFLAPPVLDIKLIQVERRLDPKTYWGNVSNGDAVNCKSVSRAESCCCFFAMSMKPDWFWFDEGGVWIVKAKKARFELLSSSALKKNNYFFPFEADSLPRVAESECLPSGKLPQGICLFNFSFLERVWVDM